MFGSCCASPHGGGALQCWQNRIPHPPTQPPSPPTTPRVAVLFLLHPQLLLTFLKKLFSPDTVGASGAGKVRPLPGCKVVVPTSNARADYMAVISGLPDVDTPALFCLPDNIDRTAQQV